MDVNLRVPGIEKLLDYAASGIGSVAGPMLASWRARREVEAKRIAVEGKVEELRILAEGQSSALQTIANAQTAAREKLRSPNIATQGEWTIGEAISQRIQFQEEKRQSNIGAVLSMAAPEIKVKDVPDYEPNHDWTARFFTEVQDVSSKEMQSLWAKVLAGEVERPGSTSIRALGILKNLDQATALLFRQLCSVCVFFITGGKVCIDARVPSLEGDAASNSLKEYGLGFGNLNVLNEHGLIISAYNSWFDYRLCIEICVGRPTRGKVPLPFGFQGRNWVLSPTAERAVDEEFQLSGVGLTQAGRELSRVVDLVPMDDYAQALMKFFQARNLTMTEVGSAAPQ